MSVRERILAIRVAELVRKNPEAAGDLGITAGLIPRAGSAAAARGPDHGTSKTRK